MEKSTDIPRTLILSPARSEEVTDARALLVVLLHEDGFYNNEIAAMVGRHVSGVRRSLAAFPYRLKGSPWLRNAYNAIKEERAKKKP